MTLQSENTNSAPESTEESGREAVQADRTVCLISPFWSAGAEPNGVGTYVSCMREAMTRHKTSVAVICEEGHSTDELSILAAARACGGPGRITDALKKLVSPETFSAKSKARRYAQALHQLQRKLKIDLVEIEEAWGVANYLVPQLSMPVVVRLHGPWILTSGPNNAARQTRRIALEGESLVRAAAVSAPSLYTLEAVRKSYGLALSNSAVIPNPMSLAWLKDRWTLQNSDPDRICFVGRFDRLKGADTLLEAFQIVHRQRPELRLTFVGPDFGVRDDFGRTLSFAQFVREKLSPAAASNIEMLGFVPPSQLNQHRLRARMTIVPSRYETFSYAALEAIACGCPLIASSVGGLSELILHGQTGLQVKPGDAGALAEQMLILLREPQLAANLGQAARVDAQKRFDPDVIARQTLEFYNGVIDSHRSSAPR